MQIRLLASAVQLAAELVGLKVDVIVTWFTPPALAAKKATADIPIVMADAGDPVGNGLVASFPGRGETSPGLPGLPPSWPARASSSSARCCRRRAAWQR
jgi:putative ABC transport system substrate-binding protein